MMGTRSGARPLVKSARRMKAARRPATIVAPHAPRVVACSAIRNIRRRPLQDAAIAWRL
jgi:hypothetical protein